MIGTAPGRTSTFCCVLLDTELLGLARKSWAQLARGEALPACRRQLAQLWLTDRAMTSIVNQEGPNGTRRIAVLVGLGMVALAVVSAIAISRVESRTPGVSVQASEPVDSQLAAKAKDSCWFKVKNRSSRSTEVRQWESVTSTGATTERLGELLIVTGAMEPAVRDDHFYGCSLFQYTQGSPVVMTATTSPSPIRAHNVIPFGFSEDGKKQQQ